LKYSFLGLIFMISLLNKACLQLLKSNKSQHLLFSQHQPVVNKIKSMKLLQAMLSKGKDTNECFWDVGKNIVARSVEVKKMVFVYLVYMEVISDCTGAFIGAAILMTYIITSSVSCTLAVDLCRMLISSQVSEFPRNKRTVLVFLLSVISDFIQAHDMFSPYELLHDLALVIWYDMYHACCTLSTHSSDALLHYIS